MDQLTYLLTQLESLEFWINTHFDTQVCMTLQRIEEAIQARHRILKRILKLQLREFNRD